MLEQLQQYRSGAMLPSSDGSKENGDGDKVNSLNFFFLNVISGLSYNFSFFFLLNVLNRVEELVLMVMAVKIKIQLIMQPKHMNFRLLLRNR